MSMSSSSLFISCTSKMSCNTKLSSLESSLQQSLTDFKEIVKEFEGLCIEAEDYKRKLTKQTEMCESKNCRSAEALKKVIVSKDVTIQHVASALTRLYETKNLNIVNEALKIICGDTPTPVKLEPSHESVDINKNLDIKREVCSPKKELSDSFQDVSFKDASLSEIEGTPGRTSPIIQTKKARNTSSDHRDKKKCPDDWAKSENKAIKLVFPTPSKSKGKGKLRQSRLNLVSVKSDSYVDLTSSPELMTRNSQNDIKPLVQILVKKESTDNDETILPSPTSGPPKFPSLLKNTRNSPFKKPPLSLKTKSEIKPAINCENSPVKQTEECHDEESINLLSPRIPICIKENSPIKDQSIDYDETNFEIPSSLSILPHVNMMSPSKRPLAENKNALNVPPAAADSSMSLLKPALADPEPQPQNDVKARITPDETIYKEPAPRKKAEKRALPGWSCDECKNFYDELYQNDPVMLEKKMNECSRHRGRRNPQRARSPGGYWNPRWDVPADTEEFNRRNNAL